MSAILAIGGGTPASAAPAVRDIDFRVWAYICDDEVIDSRDNCGEHRMARRWLTVPTENALRWRGCQGGEVTVDVEVTTRVRPFRKAEVHAGVMFLAGGSCRSLDVEDWQKVTFDLAEGAEAVKTFVG